MGWEVGRENPGCSLELPCSADRRVHAGLYIGKVTQSRSGGLQKRHGQRCQRSSLGYTLEEDVGSLSTKWGAWKLHRSPHHFLRKDFSPNLPLINLSVSVRNLLSPELVTDAPLCQHGSWRVEVKSSCGMVLYSPVHYVQTSHTCFTKTSRVFSVICLQVSIFPSQSILLYNL